MEKVIVWIKKIFGFLFILAGILAFVFFSNYNGKLISNPNLWYILGILIIILGFLLLKSAFFTNKNKDLKALKRELAGFKLTAEKINVDLKDCIIKSNNYIEEIEKVKSYRVNAMDAIYDSSKNMQQLNINQAVLIFKNDKYGQKEIFYSAMINKNEITIRFLIDRQKETYIYVDRANRENYYFDLEFLHETDR